MSWGIHLTGSKAGILAALKDPERCKASGDPSQFDAAKALIIAEVEATPEADGYDGAKKGVQVDAHGSHGQSNRNLKIQIDQIDLHVEG